MWSVANLVSINEGFEVALSIKKETVVQSLFAVSNLLCSVWLAMWDEILTLTSDSKNTFFPNTSWEYPHR